MAHTSQTAPTPPRWARRKEARPAELLAAALDLFVERGYAATRLDDVAARAQVSKGTLYLYFENKEQLFKAVVRENIVARLSAAQEEIDLFEGSASDLLRTLIARWWEEFGSTKAAGITKLMVAESGNFPEITSFYLEEVIEPWHRIVRQVTARGVAHGEFRPVDLETFVQVFSAPLIMLTLWRHSFGPCSLLPMDAQRYMETLADTMVSALSPHAKPPAAPARRARVTRRTGHATKRTDRAAK